MAERTSGAHASEQDEPIDTERRRVLRLGAAALVASAAAHAGCAQAPASAQRSAATAGAQPDVAPSDRVFITNEDSNTLSVIDPSKNAVDTTINLTSFDEDARPPFRFVTGGVIPTHAAMIQKPLYHGCISAHGAAPKKHAL